MEARVVGASGRAGLRVVHVLAPSPAGGLESVVRALARGQQARSHDVHVLAVVEPAPEDHPFLASLAQGEVAVDPVHVPHRHYGREFRRLRSELARRRPDVVHTHGYRGDVIGGCAARSLGLPVVSTVHGFTWGGVRNRAYEWLQRLRLRQFGTVVAVSRSLGVELERSGVPRERLHVVPNAWPAGSRLCTREEARERLGLSPDGFVVGWVGRLSPEKDPAAVVRAAARLPYADIVIAVIGNGPRRSHLEELSEELGAADRVRFLGRVDDASELYRAFDVFVLTSRTEGTPVVLFEAMEARVPIVATSVGGVPDVVGDGEGLLVEPGDVDGLVRAIRTVRERPGPVRERTRRAYDTLRSRFALEPWIGRYRAIYERASVRDGVESP